MIETKYKRDKPLSCGNLTAPAGRFPTEPPGIVLAGQISIFDPPVLSTESGEIFPFKEKTSLRRTEEAII